MPVDLFGRVASRSYSGIILADSCQAAGAYKGMASALAASFSFNGVKNVPAGECGLLISDDGDLVDAARQFVSHGENLQINCAVGLNGRVNEVTACIAYHGLLAVEARNAQRQRLAMELWRRLKDESRVRVLTPQEIEGHALYVYPLVLRGGVDRAWFCRRLKKLGVETSEGYIRPHLGHYPAFKSAVRIPMPVVEELSESTLVLLLQVRPPATLQHMRYIATAIRASLDAKNIKNRAKIGYVDSTAF